MYLFFIEYKEDPRTKTYTRTYNINTNIQIKFQFKDYKKTELLQNT